ncbi:MAG: hypothetical protein ABI602_03410 [Candidatus Saccharibacteria bacterium]
MGNHVHSHSQTLDQPGQVAGIAVLSAAVGALAAVLVTTPRSAGSSRQVVGHRLTRQAAALWDRLRRPLSSQSDNIKPTPPGSPDQEVPDSTVIGKPHDPEPESDDAAKRADPKKKK